MLERSSVFHFEDYLKIRKAQRICKSTLEEEIIQQNYFWKFLDEQGFSGNKLNIARDSVLKYSEHIHLRDDLKANSKLHRLQMIRYFYKEAIKQEWILDNPFKRIALPKQEETLPSILSVKQMKRLLVLPHLDTVMGLRDRTILELLYSCGLRKSELVQIKSEDFKEDFRLLRVLGKGQKEAILPVGKQAAHFSKFYIEKLRPLLKKKDRELVFSSLKTGKALDARYLERIVKSYGLELGIKERIFPHTIRYSIATHLSEEGVDLRMIQVFLRHESIDTTSRYIRHDFKHLQTVHKQTHPRETL